MLVDPAKTALFIPGNLKKFKLNLFNRIGQHIESLGGQVIRSDASKLKELPDSIIPIVGCQPESTPFIKDWRARKRNWIYWDRGYCRRVFATWLPRGEDGGYYRWHLNNFQMQSLKFFEGTKDGWKTLEHAPDDRWKSMQTDLLPWQTNPNGHIVLAAGSATYERFHDIEGWIDRTVAELRKHTHRDIRISDKECKTPLLERLKGAHALVTHGSNSAVEAVIMGCPVFVHKDSAASLVGQTDLSKIESPIYPEREAWVRSLAYNQFNERELVDGTLWKYLS